MKIAFYFDWFPGMDLQFATASVKPMGANLLVGGKRYKFVVEIDDPNAPASTQEVAGQEVDLDSPKPE